LRRRTRRDPPAPAGAAERAEHPGREPPDDVRRLRPGDPRRPVRRPVADPADPDRQPEPARALRLQHLRLLADRRRRRALARRGARPPLVGVPALRLQLLDRVPGRASRARLPDVPQAPRMTEALVTRPSRRGRRSSSPAELVAADAAIRAVVPRWHFEMLNDRERNDAFDAAISRVVRPGDLVLDIGTCAGLLALLAARYGAERVVSCEGVEQVADVAEQVAARNGFGDRISIVRKWST